MKAEINEYGTLTITPQTKMEAFALKIWSDSIEQLTFKKEDGKEYALIIRMEVPQKKKKAKG